MKRSEFLDDLKRLIISTEQHNLDAAGALAEEAGVKWDPEETELPKRLMLTEDGDLAVPYGNAIRGYACRAATLPEKRVAVDAYNRLQSGELVQAQPPDAQIGISWGVHAADVAVLTSGKPGHRPLTLKEAVCVTAFYNAHHTGRGILNLLEATTRKLEAVTAERNELQAGLREKEAALAAVAQDADKEEL